MPTLRPLSFGMLFLIGLGIVATPAPADAQVHITGQWTTLPYPVPINPIHVAVMRNGKVLIVAGSENYEVSSEFKAAVWDPIAGTFSQQLTPWDLFCNGMSFLPDGRVIMTGGNLVQLEPGPGPPWTTIFDPATEQFYQLEDMARGRWYPTNTALSDGGTLTFGGLDEQSQTNNTVEIYDIGLGWTPPYQANFSTGWYPRLHLLANGKVFFSGPNEHTHTFDPATAAWTTGPNTNYNEMRLYGASVLLPLDVADDYRPRVVIFGGNVNGPATNTVEFIDLGADTPAWVYQPPMSVPRVTLNTVLLPNGKILTFGGSTYFNDPATAHLSAQTFDPVAQTWTPSGTMAYARLYHSSALLLPDATVWVAGSNPNRLTWTPQMEIYKPPYLFTPGGDLAPRPTLGTIPAVVGYGQTFTVNTPDAATIDKVMFIRPGSNTHSFDQEQRLIYTQFTRGTGTLSVTAPLTPGAAPPGYYMLFIIDSSGVPSVAKFIQLRSNPTNQSPTATITNPPGDVSIQAGQPVTFEGTATDPDGSVALYHWVFPGGSPNRSNLQNPGAVTFATPGVYTASMTVVDDLGLNNPSPPTRTITVTGTPALQAAITSPQHGGIVGGTVRVNMAATNIQGYPTYFLLYLDGETLLSEQSITSGSTASFDWNTTTTSDGPHGLYLLVIDGAGRSADAAISVTVQNEGGGGTQPVVWTNAVNVAVTGNTITKNGGCDGCWDAGASSQQAITAGNGYVEFQTSSGAMLWGGLSSGHPVTTANQIKYALRFFPTYVEVRETGAYQSEWPIAAGDLHRVAVENGAVKYYQNGTLKYTSTQAPTYPLQLYGTVEMMGSAVQGAMINY
jgi:hypothetical protein